MSTSSAASTPSSTAATFGVPRVGGVRCYWSLIRPRYPTVGQNGQFELEFVHPDPVLAVHLASQRLSLMGRGLLEFIHPAERERARSDLSNAISLDDLQGSVTRVRFARLSCIRRLLGCQPEELEVPYDASTFTEDDQYLILDLVINWVADGLLLAFFHAIVDKDPKANNDPNKQHEEWTNYCGTAKMGEDQIEALQQSISSKIALPPLTRFPPQRIFQIHTSEESPVRPGQLIFSWPPARPSGVESYNDGRYNAEEYARLMDGVITNGRRYASGETHTNCTTRFGATHSITSEGAYRHVSSVFIPYGTLVFAAFQTTKQVELQPRPVVDRKSIQTTDRYPGNGTMPITVSVLGQRAGEYLPPPAQEWQMSMNGWSPQALGESNLSHGQPYPSAGSTFDPSQQSPIIPESFQRSFAPNHPLPPSSQYDGSSVQAQAPLSSHHMFPPSTNGSQQNHYDPTVPVIPVSSQHSALPMPIQQSEPLPDRRQAFGQPSYAPQAAYESERRAPQHSQSADESPRRTSYAASDGHSTYRTSSPSAQYHHEMSPSSPIRNGSQGSGSSRPLVRPPGDVECCRTCGLRESPEWRRSESGVKDLCNACGLRLARHVAKREGRQKPRKKKEKT